MAGRPTKYTDEIAEEICKRICSGESLRAICMEEGMPSKGAVLLWVVNDREGFSDRYEKACIVRAYLWAEEIIDISDDGTNDWMEVAGKDGETVGWKINGEAVSRSRLRIDSRKWIVSKMIPKFSDNKDSDVGGTENMAAVISRLIEKLPS